MTKSSSLLKKRYRSERRFKLYGILALLFGVLSLLLLIISIFSSGHSAFKKTTISLEITFSNDVLEIDNPSGREELENANYQSLLYKSLYRYFPDVTARSDKRKIKQLLSSNAAFELQQIFTNNPELLGTTKTLSFTASSDVDQIHKGNAPRDIESKRRILDDLQLSAYDRLVESGKIDSIFNWSFFSSGDSRSPELAGIGGAFIGSLFTLIVCLVVAFPIAVAAAIYLEEFAPSNRFTDIIEVNINNLAAVPSIIYGLLGLAVILNLFGLPRGTPLVGGVVLGLMTLPTIIIAARASLRAVPPSIRQAAMAMGASPMQVVFHHVLPLALPGTLTGTIIGLSRALGETAPLLMIGMVAFIVDIPDGVTDPSAVLPVQIYLWAESAERGFVEKTSAAIIIILAFLAMMNGVAIFLRNKYEQRW